MTELDRKLLQKIRRWGGDHEDTHQQICFDLLEWINDLGPTKGEVADALDTNRDATIDRVRDRLLSPAGGQSSRDRGRGVAHKESDPLESRHQAEVIDYLTDNQKAQFATVFHAIDSHLPTWFCASVADYIQDPLLTLRFINESRKIAKRKSVTETMLDEAVQVAIRKAASADRNLLARADSIIHPRQKSTELASNLERSTTPTAAPMQVATERPPLALPSSSPRDYERSRQTPVDRCRQPKPASLSQWRRSKPWLRHERMWEQPRRSEFCFDLSC